MRKLILMMGFLMMTSPLFSAELLIKVGDSPSPKGFKDGDIIHAFNDATISYVNAHSICHPSKMPFTSNNTRPKGCLAEKFLDKTRELKFQRISEKEIKRINLLTGEEDILSDKPNSKKEYIDVPLYIQQRKATSRAEIFGDDGQEYWYGGDTIINKAKIDEVWVEIESKTGKKKIDKFPWKDKELKDYLIISVEDFDATTMNELTASVSDADDVIISKRTKKVDYKSLAIDVADKDKIGKEKIDLRGKYKFNVQDIAKNK